MYKILCIGPMWRGSNAGGLFRAFSRIGHLISVIDEFYHIPLSGRSHQAKIVQKLTRNVFVREFNDSILREAALLKPDFVLVYKGAFVKQQTLYKLKNAGFSIVNFYPDVSFMAHGSLLKTTLPLYDHVFTTKTFGIHDMREKLGVLNATFIPHGFDPDIHHPMQIESKNMIDFNCDVSFIGGYSQKKEQLLSAIKETLPNIRLKIWGGRWRASTSSLLSDAVQNREILGDLYVHGIQASEINLSLLHEQVKGASSGDRITSRTFHIPAAGGFMIHERTDEVLNYFKEDEEMVCYGNEDELVEKVKYYLNHSKEREKIRINGHQRALKGHSLDQRAMEIMRVLNDQGII